MKLDIAWAKLLRAEKHFQVAVKMTRRFVHNDCKLVSEFNPKTNHFDVIAKIPDPPIIIGLLVGDCVHNMRSALDHIVYAFSRGKSKGATASEKAMFPICDTRSGYFHQVNTLKRIDGVPEPVAALIDSLQPYHRRERGLDHTRYPLWILNKLENIDKHRRLTLTSAVARHAHVKVAYQDGGEMEMLHLENMIYDGAVLTSYPPAPDGSEVKMNGYLLIYIALNEVDELPSMVNVDFAYVLNALLDQLGNAIFPKFRALAARHKGPIQRHRRRRKRQDLRPLRP